MRICTGFSMHIIKVSKIQESLLWIILGGVDSRGLVNKTATEQQQKTELISEVGRINPISTGGGGGVFSTSSPVNGSELQNGTSYHLETW